MLYRFNINNVFNIVYSINSHIFAELKYRNYEPRHIQRTQSY